ncbi:MAG: hypothetical protein HeimC3_49260 [Candidatus Heimdallarchaeota archaeon LC_3]|nr:MAG: hypothetical protein HeimC3_49260 [Candidatus Heimdallarchaeota archaeon LC_3]
MTKNKYWNPAYKLKKILKNELKPIMIDTILDLLEFKTEKEFIDFYVECSLTGIDIDWSNKTVTFSESIISELEDLIGNFELQSLFDK